MLNLQANTSSIFRRELSKVSHVGRISIHTIRGVWISGQICANDPCGVDHYYGGLSLLGIIFIDFSN